MAGQKAFLYNQNYCVGCHSCETACMVKNQVDVGVSWRTLDSFEVEINGRMVERYLSHSCMHCAEPQCASVCPTKAYTKREDGLVIQDHDKCVGCGYCIYACPYQAPKMNPYTKKTEKCTGCYDLIDAGEQPMCVRGCPVQVLKIEDIDKLDAEGAVKEAIGFQAFATNPSMRFVKIKQ
ncbi:4Fe-4S dicluster domain-containing protein [Desulfitobacterium chlororespirans]|uniref:Fe-S-cluster-containing dehydrogenase component n=1 Tax=Desulfitobacterium chlororespirans DSM 11544 TaxID=1121395 RepID=A0A1M7SNV1_9FIRM|nr:4Fe-4S dicluster domain-containing protein [Desulfitobacterium chlororespirans]SHN60192.1 Fe-S-cluster-containing dehydrogenase component [Desulfitobacterium chlororespirans DSM 11544]